jgi:choline dehydrogenase-like flavoprotein
VVLAAGTVDSTVIALRSSSADFPDGLGNSRGLVGRYLHDHPREWWIADTSRPLTAPAHPLYIARRPHDESPPLLATSLTIGLAAPAERLRTYYRGRTTRFGVQVFGTMVPTPEVGISLDEPDGADPRAARPSIRLDYPDDAVANTVSARDRFREVLACAGIDAHLPGPFHALEPGSSVHLAGSMRMHDDPAHGVTDGWNRMHDAPNVIVADMSCFTTGPEKNPTLTAMALAMRAADRLATDLGRPPVAGDWRLG